MARNQLEKYFNQLDIRRADYLSKQQKEYKFQRFQKSLEVLQRVSYHHTIPDNIISKIELIFKLMPTHELYYIKKDEAQFKEYVHELNQLYIMVLDDYEEYIEERDNVLKTVWDILFPLMLLIIFFYDKLQKWIGLNLTLISITLLFVFLLYLNRKKLWKNPFI